MITTHCGISIAACIQKTQTEQVHSRDKNTSDISIIYIVKKVDIGHKGSNHLHYQGDRKKNDLVLVIVRSLTCLAYGSEGSS